MRRNWFIFIFSIYFIISAIFYYKHLTVHDRPEKSSLYLESSRVVDAFSPPKKPEDLTPIFDGKYNFYTEKLSAFYLNIHLTIGLCIVGCVLLFRNQAVESPIFPVLKIPTPVAYLVIPGALMYFWLQFGFLLHHLIDARIALFSLIESQYALSHFHEVPSPDAAATHVKYLYSLTRANDLRDTGFLDSWFLTFLPKYFATSTLSGFDRLVPVTTMITVGVLYGISHGLAIGLPFNWISRYDKRKLRYRLIAGLLLVVNLFFIFASHITFYITGRNYNWLSFIILACGLISFWIVVAAEDHARLVRQKHLRIKDTEQRENAPQTPF